MRFNEKINKEEESKRKRKEKHQSSLYLSDYKLIADFLQQIYHKVRSRSSLNWSFWPIIILNGGIKVDLSCMEKDRRLARKDPGKFFLGCYAQIWLGEPWKARYIFTTGKHICIFLSTFRFSFVIPKSLVESNIAHFIWK